MPRYSISNAPTEVVGLYAGSGVFRERLGDIDKSVYRCIYGAFLAISLANVLNRPHRTNAAHTTSAYVD